MLFPDHRMVQGQPLHYLHSQQDVYFTHVYNKPWGDFMEVSEDSKIAPESPNSAQSDSDNSLSSVEITTRPIRARTMIQYSALRTGDHGEIRCCWTACGDFFDTLEQLAGHVTKVHASSGPGGLFYCGWEGCTRNTRGFNARYKMLVHVRTHTNEKPHRCFECDKSFSRAENLKIHSRSHSGEKPYACPVPGCTKAYSNSSDRFKHTRTHQVEKPYRCKVSGCPKRYTDPSSLRKHVKTYKHFAGEENEKKSVKVDLAHQCDCTYMCCATNLRQRDQQSAEYLRLIDLKNTEQITNWTELEYSIHHSVDLDVDMPLDLSTHRKLI